MGEVGEVTLKKIRAQEDFFTGPTQSSKSLATADDKALAFGNAPRNYRLNQKRLNLSLRSLMLLPLNTLTEKRQMS